VRAAPSSGGYALGLVHTPDIQGHNAVLALKPLAADRPEEMGAIPTPAVPPGQESRFVRIEEAAVAGMHRLALGTRRALEVPLHRAPTEADLRGDGIEGPSLLMGSPDLLVVRSALGAPLAGQSCRRGGRRWRGERHRGGAGVGGRGGRVVQRRGHGDALGMDPRQLRSVGPEHVGQHIRQIVQQMKAVGHLAGDGRPQKQTLPFNTALLELVATWYPPLRKEDTHGRACQSGRVAEAGSTAGTVCPGRLCRR
jgi:hypothetical protein